MDHVVYLDASAGELDKLLSGQKTAILRGATGRKMPYGRVNPGDVLYFLKNDAEGLVRASAIVKSVLNTPALSAAESAQLVEQYQAELQFTPKQITRWSGKRYLVLIEVEQTAPVEPFGIDKCSYGNMDDWLPVGDIHTVRR